MSLQDAIRTRLVNLMELYKVNGNKLALRGGFTRSCINKFIRKETKILELQTIALICEALNIKLVDFFNDSLFDNVEIDDIEIKH